jgi:hypothetical protein
LITDVFTPRYFAAETFIEVNFMKIIKQSIANEEMAGKIGATIKDINKFITPKAQTGELIIAYSANKATNDWDIMFHGSLEDGVGNSCAMAKLRTLINHPEYNWGGSIPLTSLGPDEKKWYGSIRLINCREADDISGWQGQMIIVFSGRVEWQDALYCAAVIQNLANVIQMEFDLPLGIMDDPIWGTAFNITKAIK